MAEDILNKIARYKREEVDARRSLRPQSDVDAYVAIAEAPRGFRAALVRAHAPGRLALIAEIKKASPSRGLIREHFDPPALARAYEAGGAACLSVLTDAPSFQGDDRYLVEAHRAVALPCIRKEFLVDPWQVAESRALGADAILVILAMVDDSLAADLMAEASRLGMDTLVETHDEVEFDRAISLGADLIGVNNRDLRTFSVNLSITERLAAKTPLNALLVTESGIFGREDAARLERCGASAMLVGESLMRQEDVAGATRALLGGSASST